MANRSRGSRAPTAGSFRRSLWRRIAVHFGEKPRDRVRPDCHVDRGEQFANEAQRGALLPQLHDAILERREFGVTGRRRRRECASGVVEALRARGDVRCFVHRISGELARGQFS